MYLRTRHLDRRQPGFALVVGLVFLLMMTLIGITAIQTSTLEERMAGNTRDRSIAVQGAEMAVRAGEQVAMTRATGDFRSGQLGLFDLASLPQPTDPENAASWTTGNSLALAFTTPGLSAAPMYWVQLEQEVKINNKNKGIGGADDTLDAQVFSITARSTGGSGNAAVVLRSTVRRITP